MPDYSIIQDLCSTLQININDLLSGEIVDKKDYQNKLEENIFTAISDINKKYYFIKRILITCFSILLSIFLFFILISNHQIILKYDKNKMFIENKNNSLVFTTKDLCTVYGGNINQYSIISDDYGIIFLTSKCSCKDIFKKSFSNGNSYRYYHIDFSNNFPTNYKIYYTEVAINKLKKANNEQLNEYISKSKLIYEQR